MSSLGEARLALQGHGGEEILFRVYGKPLNSLGQGRRRDMV